MPSASSCISSRDTKQVVEPGRGEVSSVHHDRVEGVTQPRVDVLEADGADVADAAPARHFDGERRDVDSDDVETAFLQVECDPPRTATDVEDAAAQLAAARAAGARASGGIARK